MMKVVRALQINDPAGLFSRELDSETLEVWWACVVRLLSFFIKLEIYCRSGGGGGCEMLQSAEARLEDAEVFTAFTRKVFLFLDHVSQQRRRERRRRSFVFRD